MVKKRDPKKVCGAKTKHGPCQQWKGAGTAHKGTGRCKNHGGASPNHQVAAEREQAIERMRTYGAPVDIDPDAALTEEVRRTAGHVRWLGNLIAELLHDGDGYEVEEDNAGRKVFRPRTGLKQMDTAGKFEKASVWVEMYQNERTMLARVCKMALDAGVAQRQIELAEAQGELLAQVVQGILDDLNLTREQRQAVPDIIRRRMLSVVA